RRAVEREQDAGRDEENRLVDGPRDRQHTHGDEPAQGTRNSPVAREDPDSADGSSQGAHQRPSLGTPIAGPFYGERAVDESSPTGAFFRGTLAREQGEGRDPELVARVHVKARCARAKQVRRLDGSARSSGACPPRATSTRSARAPGRATRSRTRPGTGAGRPRT